MAPIVREGIIELQDDSLGTMQVNFDEISSLSTSENFLFDNSKLWENNVLGLLQQPAGTVQPASIQPLLVAEEYSIHSEFSDPQPEILVLQPAVLEASVQPVLQQTQSPEPCDIQAIGSLQPDLLDFSAIPEPFTIQVETFSPQQGEMDLLEPPPSLESTADASVLSHSPSSVWQQGQKPASPASQHPADTLKKRGRRRKHPEGVASCSRRTRKPKKYELEPLSDEESEKKRRNAVTAKKHRDMQKAQMQKLSHDLTEAKAERDRLKLTVNQYKQREQQLLQMLSGHGIKVDGLHPSLEAF